jgi:hypothetical protein
MVAHGWCPSNRLGGGMVNGQPSAVAVFNATTLAALMPLRFGSLAPSGLQGNSGLYGD